MDDREKYRRLYLKYSQGHLRKRRKQLEDIIRKLESEIRTYKPKAYRGMLKEEYMRCCYLENLQKLDQHKIELEVIQELIKPRLVNWKVCVIVCTVGFVLLSGPKSEKVAVDEKDTKPSSSMHNPEEDKYTFIDLIRDLIEITAAQVEKEMAEQQAKR